jgi:GT2 family glycosyltransferase
MDVMPNPDVAAIIVTYRSAALTVEGLRSLERERARGDIRLRAVVVDNASGDLAEIGAAVRANGWEDWVTLLASARNGGFAYGNNLGIRCAFREAVPDYVYFLNPDAQVRPGAIKTLVDFLDSHPDAGVAGGSFEESDGRDWPIAFRFPSLIGEVIGGLEFGLFSRLFKKWEVARVMEKQNAPVDWVSGAAMLIRPALLERIGGLDENYFLYFEETDFCLRAKRAGFSTWYVPASRVMHIAGQSTKVTGRTDGPRRLPEYWFASRRRYFAMAFGVGTAMLIDIAALAACSLGHLKRIALGRRSTATPYFIRDLARNSILWKRNRRLPSFHSAALTDPSNRSA